jgi:hypothetical protein
MGGTAAGNLTNSGAGFGAQGKSPTAWGSISGTESRTISLAQLPTITSTGTFSLNNPHGFVTSDQFAAAFSTGTGGSSGWLAFPITASVGVANYTDGSAIPAVQPTLIAECVCGWFRDSHQRHRRRIEQIAYHWGPLRAWEILELDFNQRLTSPATRIADLSSR